MFDSKSSSERQTLYKNEWGSLANVDLVVAKMVPPTFNLTHEANEANGGFWLEFDSTASILAISNRTGNTKGLVNQFERKHWNNPMNLKIKQIKKDFLKMKITNWKSDFCQQKVKLLKVERANFYYHIPPKNGSI